MNKNTSGVSKYPIGPWLNTKRSSMNCSVKATTVPVLTATHPIHNGQVYHMVSLSVSTVLASTARLACISGNETISLGHRITHNHLRPPLQMYSFVRSISMDKWFDDQLQKMEVCVYYTPFLKTT